MYISGNENPHPGCASMVPRPLGPRCLGRKFGCFCTFLGSASKSALLLVSWSCPNKALHTGRLKTTEVESLTVLEIRSLKSGVGRASGEDPSWPLPAPGARASLACSCSPHVCLRVMCILPEGLCLHMAFSSRKDSSHIEIRAHDDLI